MMVYRQQTLSRWALERAMYANAHINPEKTPPFEVEDFLPGGNRARRLNAAQSDRTAVDFAVAQMALIKPGVIPEGLPEWAIGPYVERN